MEQRVGVVGAELCAVRRTAKCEVRCGCRGACVWHRYEAPRRPPVSSAAGKDSRVSAALRRQLEDQAGRFDLEVDWIKASPSEWLVVALSFGGRG